MTGTLLAFIMLAMPVMALAKPLTVTPGEAWLFAIEQGDPCKALAVRIGSFRPAKGGHC